MCDEIIDRFIEKIDVKGPYDCWSWLGTRHPQGYGYFYMQGKNWRATRAAYFLFLGQDPGDLLVRHKCNNPVCVNPGHLHLGTHAENMKDMTDSQRQARGSKNARAKWSEEQVRAIKQAFLDDPVSKGRIGRVCALFPEIPLSTIEKMLYNQKWKHIGLTRIPEPKTAMLKDEQVRAIRIAFASDLVQKGRIQRMLAAFPGISQKTLENVVYNIKYKHVKI